MIYPTDEQLLAGIAEALKDTVLPDLERGTAARKQLQAAIEILRRMAFALPGEAAALAADNDDMANVLRRVAVILRSEALPLEGEGLAGSDASARNKALQEALGELQADLPKLPTNIASQITLLLTGLYKRMTDRALALIPPPLARTPRKPS